MDDKGMNKYLITVKKEKSQRHTFLLENSFRKPGNKYETKINS